MSIDRNNLAYWFPKLLAAKLPVPKTIILTMPVPAQESVFAGFDGKDEPEGSIGEYRAFADRVRAAAAELGGAPVFLRTGHTSGKHEWARTCYLADLALTEQHLFALAEHSELCGLPGLPWDTWAVRELLPTVQYGVCPDYGGMPVAREFRCFVDGGVLRCAHPYWPLESLADGGASPECMAAANRGASVVPRVVTDLARRAGAVLAGEWSVDILDTTRGWFITDCALAAESFHWPDCINARARETAAV